MTSAHSHSSQMVDAALIAEGRRPIDWAIFHGGAARTSLRSALKAISAARQWNTVELLTFGLAGFLRGRAASNAISHLQQANRCLIDRRTGGGTRASR